MKNEKERKEKNNNSEKNCWHYKLIVKPQGHHRMETKHYVYYEPNTVLSTNYPNRICNSLVQAQTNYHNLRCYHWQWFYTWWHRHMSYISETQSPEFKPMPGSSITTGPPGANWLKKNIKKALLRYGLRLMLYTHI